MTTSDDLEVSEYSSVNARYSSPPQVARTFVPPDSFARLIQPEHSVLVGPRGSGKTSMMKMLQQEALEVWDHPLAEFYCDRISFVAILIPADPAWHAQLESLGEAGGVTQETARSLADAAFTTHVLHSLVKTMRARIAPVKDKGLRRTFRRAQMVPAQEAELVQEISDPWQITPRLLTLASLSNALNARIARIGQAAAGAFTDEDARYLHIDFMAASTLAVDIFNELSNQSNQRWAFLFDELEIAPQHIRRKLIRSFRSGNPRLFLKLSLFPFTDELSVQDPARDPLPGQDYDYISLSVPRTAGSFRFADELANAVLRARGAKCTAAEFLGTPYFAPSSDIDNDAEEDDDPLDSVIRRPELRAALIRLSQRDEGFRRYMAAHGLRDDLTIEASASAERARKAFRKVKNQALTRSWFAGSPRRQSRRSYALYTGVPTIYQLTESNPRYLLIFLRSVLEAVPPSRNRASRLQQSRALGKAQAHFLDLLRAVAIGMPEEQSSWSQSGPTSLVDFIDRIGAFMQRAVLDGPFDPDAVGSFYVERDSAPEIRLFAERAVNVGAVVRLPSREQEYSPLMRMDGQRLRLSFLLAPRYHLPVRVGRALRLESLLGQGLQPTLFDLEDASDES